MTKLQTALLEQGLLEKVNKQFQYGFVYEIYPDELQRLYIHKNCGCKRQLHNLFVEELYSYLEGIGFQKGLIPDEFIKNLSSTKSYKDKFQYMKEVDSLALSAARLDFVGRYVIIILSSSSKVIITKRKLLNRWKPSAKSLPKFFHKDGDNSAFC